MSFAPKRSPMHYTVLVLQFLLAQFIIGFIAAMVTANMGAAAIYWRRKVLRTLWAVTGYVLVAAIAYDTYIFFRN